ncbi:hypothetical protein D0X99_12725 [Algoriphagus lacus]|uniref:Uncharacterized protein n=1 Tax=Algoriphagus lacus TaxID=2056311 RepID=A0A418PQ59_9BACT|nr:hypothetical protein [Algoriphagus lacus]RIW14422.1 hypothetical protein D0X99_12725 [Algoriphagus lacus]
MLIFSGCKSYRNLENIQPKTVREAGESFKQSTLEKLVEGDKIRIVSTNGVSYHLQFTKVEEGKITGVLSESGEKKLETPEPFDIEISSIEKLEVYRKSPALTAVAIYIPVATILAIILLSGGAGMTF